NYVLWGLYHGVLLVLTRAGRTAKPLVGSVAPWIRVPQIAGMFLLTNLGWLLFRETSLAAIVRHLTLSPFNSGVVETEIAAHLFLLAFLYSLPLWIHSVWMELHRTRDGARAPAPVARAPWGQVAFQGAACGLAFAAILVLRSRTSLDFIYFQF